MRALYVITAAALIAAAALCGTAIADDDDCCAGLVRINADEAFTASQRVGRDPVEGFYEGYMDWFPEALGNPRMRVALARNTFGVYPEWDYVAATTCGRYGCKSGTVRMVLKKTAAPKIFEARIFAGDGYAEGRALLVSGEDGRPDAEIDMTGVRYDGRMLTYGFVRIKGR